MNEEVHSAIENVGKPVRKKAAPKAPSAAPAAPTKAPAAPTRNGSGRKTAAPRPAQAAPKATPAPNVERTVRKGPTPLMFRTGRNPQTFADAIADARTKLADAKKAYGKARLDLAAAEKARKQLFGEYHGAYKSLGLAIAETPLHSDGNKAVIASAQAAIKSTKSAHAVADKDNGVASKAADKAQAAVKKAEDDLQSILDAKTTARAAAKGA